MNLIVQSAAYTTIAMGIVFVLLLGEIDLSVGYVSGVAGVIVTILLIPDGNEVPTVVAIVAALAAGAAIGTWHGILFAKVGIPSFVVTLAGLIAWNGVVLLLIGSRGTVILQDDFIIDLANGFLSEGTAVDADAGLRRALRGHAAERDPRAAQGRARAGAVPAAGAARGWACHRARRSSCTWPTRTAASPTWACSWRRCSCSGPSSSGARASAATCTPSAATPRRPAAPASTSTGSASTCFAICSLMAAVGGIILASRLRSVDTNAGGGSILLYSIAAAVIGGTSLFGGRGHIKSALLGALVIASIDNGLGLLGLGSGREVRDHRRRPAARGHGGLRFAPPPGAGRALIAALFVTGASKGVGAAVARRFADEGWRVACASRSGSDLGLDGALGLVCDVRDPAQVDAAVATAVTELGGLDAVVANAGVGSYGPFLELPPEQVDEMIDVNLKGTLHTARAVLPHLIESKGDFLSLSSVAGLRGVPGRDGLQRLEVRSARASRARSTTRCASWACA